MEDAMPSSTKRDAVILFIAEKKLRRAIAKTCKISLDAIKQWRRVPPLRVIAVERITGIPRHVIRKDIYPNPSKERPYGKARNRKRTNRRARPGSRRSDRRGRR
jgi:DNA-binding transcriptional regulator YdaS (Cro superfamily)